MSRWVRVRTKCNIVEHSGRDETIGFTTIAGGGAEVRDVATRVESARLGHDFQ